MRDLASITRRGLVQTGAAALGAGVAGISVPALASPTPDADAALIDFIARHATALTDLAALDDVADPFRNRFEAMAPERPAALRWRAEDFPRTSLGRGLSDNDVNTDERWYFFRGVEWLRKAHPVAQWTEEAEARRREIVEAHDAWMAEREALADRIGLTAANAKCDRVSDTVCEIEMAIMDRGPVTLGGFRAKAQWIAASKQPEDWAEVLLRDLCGGVVV